MTEHTDTPAPLSSGEALTRAFEKKLEAALVAQHELDIGPVDDAAAYDKRNATRDACLALYREALADRERWTDEQQAYVYIYGRLGAISDWTTDQGQRWLKARDAFYDAARAHQEDRDRE